jgi:hypothetical protein
MPGIYRTGKPLARSDQALPRGPCSWRILLGLSPITIMQAIGAPVRYRPFLPIGSLCPPKTPF